MTKKAVILSECEGSRAWVLPESKARSFGQKAGLRMTKKGCHPERTRGISGLGFFRIKSEILPLRGGDPARSWPEDDKTKAYPEILRAVRRALRMTRSRAGLRMTGTTTGLRMTGTRTGPRMAGTRTGPGMAGAQAASYRDGRRWISILPASVLSYPPAKEAEPAPWAKTGTPAPEWPKDDQVMPAFRPRMRVAVTERGS